MIDRRKTVLGGVLASALLATMLISMPAANAAQASTATPAAASPADTTHTTLEVGQDRVVQELDTVAQDRLPSTGPDTVAPVESINIHFLVGVKVGTTTSGLTAVHNVAKDTDGAIRKIIDGTQILAILRGRDAPTDISYVVSGSNIHLSPDALGGIVVSKTDGTVVGYINAPWAADAHGKSLQTSYKVSGNVVTQYVNTAGAVFPVIVDPHYTWGWISGTVYFNRRETRDLAFGLGGLAAAGIFLPPPFDAIVSGLSGILAAEVAIAENHGWCVDVNTRGQIGFYSGSQGNGYCR